MADYTANGGGATHIAKVTGQLKDLSSNLSDILIVSGGGGGGLLIGETQYPGADAGGIAGSGDNSADQTTGYAFGQGESGTDVSGGGGGLYGGYKGTSSKSGGAGSGYIGNPLLSNKKMVGFNVPTSSAEAAKTESVNVYSATAEENKPKAENGFARVKFLRGRQLFEHSNQVTSSQTDGLVLDTFSLPVGVWLISVVFKCNELKEGRVFCDSGLGVNKSRNVNSETGLNQNLIFIMKYATVSFNVTPTIWRSKAGTYTFDSIIKAVRLA